ncbi:MAG: nicotinate (nicotinamide) nucleotide adenylyltransferase [Candidatus Faecousia sp.]|nr:nicotinate (nicotinamide) nucleotide adenylyltransferase [Candidatus Faecousia sp.]
MEKIGIFGGSFNPPHLGHIRGAEYALEALGLTKLLLIPTRHTPGKPVPETGAGDAQRLEMLSLAAAREPRLEVSDLELREDGFTWETIQRVSQAHPGAKLYLLLGTDMFQKFPQWKNAEDICKNTVIAALRRGDKKEAQILEQTKALLEGMGGSVELLANPVTAISSTQLRRLIAFRAGREFLDPAVFSYIQNEKLYDSGADFRNLPMEELQKVVVRLLNPNRVNHVLGCRDTAVELARRWGANETDAGRAGLLHDITKALDGPLQLTLCAAYGRMLDDFSRKYPKTLHALTGSLVAREIFGENEAVVSAIESHTTGKADMNLLETIIYVADYMEPNRDFPGVEQLRELAFSDIRAALKLGLEMTLEHLAEQGGEVSPASREALAFLNEQ